MTKISLTSSPNRFLFNCLNSISALCGSDPLAARRMSTRLGQFLRSSLKLSATDKIPLTEELELARAYLEVEGVRYGDRLTFVEEIEPTCEEIEIPALLLQPLLENALKHGIAHLVNGGTVRGLGTVGWCTQMGPSCTRAATGVDTGSPSTGTTCATGWAFLWHASSPRWLGC